jgi:hypothetical protein
MRAVIALGVVTGLFLGLSLVVDRWVTVSQVAFLVACGVVLSAVPPASSADPDDLGAPARGSARGVGRTYR